MSHGSTHTRSLAALAAFGALVCASSAQAATTSLRYSCNYPLVGPAPTQVDATVSSGGQLSIAFKSLVTESDGEDYTYVLYKLVRDTAFEGTATSSFALTKAGGQHVEGSFETDVPHVTLPAAPPLLYGGGSVALSSSLTSGGRLTLGDVDLNLRAFDRNGLPDTRFAAAQELPDSDSDPATFDVHCVVDGVQDTTILGDRTIPTPAPTPTPTATPLPDPTPEPDPTETPTPTAAPDPTVTPTVTPGPVATPDPGDPAGTVRLNFTALYPLLGETPTSIGFSVSGGDLSFSVDSTAAEDGDDPTFTGFKLVKIASLSGTATAELTLVRPDGSTVSASVTGTVGQTLVPSAPPVRFRATGALPSALRGEGRLAVESVAFNLVGVTKDGRVITNLAAAQEVPDSDGDLTTFDVPVTLGAGQNGTIRSGGQIGTPTKTPTPSPTPTGYTTPTPIGLPTPRPTKTPTVVTTPGPQPSGTPFPRTPTPTATPTPVRTPGTGTPITPVPTKTATPLPKTPTPTKTPTKTATKTATPLPKTPTPTVTPRPPVKYGYAISGTATLKGQAKGTLPLSGSADAALTLATGAVSANLTLADTTGTLTIGGTVPVKAKVQLVPQGPATGTLTGAGLAINATVRIKIPSVTLLGLQIAGGASCQAKDPSVIALKSGAAFDPLAGGSLTGSFAISALTGCGSLNSTVSSLTAGGGNTVALKLTPKK